MAPVTAGTSRLLDDDIRELEQLDEFRSEFQSWRNLARGGLEQFAACVADPQKAAASKWNTVIQLDDKALVVKALCRPGRDTTEVKVLLDELRSQSIKDMLGPPAESPVFSGDSNKTTFLTAAYVLDALASAPEAVFSPATMFCYYAVIRELYYPSAPVWMVGGARAGAGGRPTAFSTSQFVRGISSFARMLDRTGQYFDALAEMHQTAETHAPEWNRYDSQRRALSLHTTLAQRTWNLAFTIKHPVPSIAADTDIRAFEAAVRHDLIESLATSITTFEEAFDTVDKYRRAECGSADSADRLHLIALSEGAHAMAARSLNDAIDRTKAARKVFADRLPKRDALLSPEERVEFASQLRDLGVQFSVTAKEVRKLFRPALDYLSNVLDNQLARATSESDAVAFEPFEMAAAAATLGAASDTWGDERLLRAAHFLGAAMTPDGFAIARPYHTGGSSYFQPSQSQILGAYAQILEHVPAELSPNILRRIRHFFFRTKQTIDATRCAWRWAHAAPKSKQSAYQTAISATALDRLGRMLDRRINDRVLQHFTTRQPTLRLQELFYPDYGLATALEADQDSTRLPIAIALERMRAHISDVSLEAPHSERLYSVVLHGPPGTGKTTVIEALAASAGVPLVEVSPSDIVFGGAEAVERRAHAVLRALSLLTRVVIIFDEFDPVLLTREEQQGPQSIFTFLTTSMLPKLKRLYESAKERRIAFALATNVIQKLDPAAVRSGRFDAWIGVYPPDILSRYGRLYTEVRRYITEAKPDLPKDLDKRFANAVMQTDRVLMPEVGKPSWFTKPSKGNIKSDSVFGYLFGGGTLPKLSRLEVPKVENGAGKKSEDLWSPTERKEWAEVTKLETNEMLRSQIEIGCSKPIS